LTDNQCFFGAVNNVVQPGTAKALTSGDKEDPNQLFLRTRLLLPPQPTPTPPPTGLPATLPGQACSKQLGTGVPAATQAANAKSIDADFAKITNMAMGNFSSQANKFFGSDIRQKLETALATSRGQIRDIYVESYGGGQASVYSVIDQVYANNTSKTPQSDVLRVVVNLTQRPAGWKVSNVTVLEGGSST
jgi:hypothetical protein